MKVVELSGGVGGARLARGLAALDGVDLTVVVNVGDDAYTHGLYVSPDIDTVVYTLADQEGPNGWGRRDDSFTVNGELARFGMDNSFRLGDLDLALKIFRTEQLASGVTLSEITSDLARAFGLSAHIVPATNAPLRTLVELEEGWTGFQDYFVTRGHRDDVLGVRFDGADTATAAPGVVGAIENADLVVVGPSNPPLSIWPSLAIDDIHGAVEQHPAVVAVSPLIGGKTVKGPADRVLQSLGLGSGNAGVAKAYEGLIDRLIVDKSDLDELPGVEVTGLDTLMDTWDASRRLAEEIVRR